MSTASGVGGGGKGSGVAGSKSRCTRTTDLSGHTLPRGKAKGVGGLDSKSMEAFIKIYKLMKKRYYVWTRKKSWLVGEV